MLGRCFEAQFVLPTPSSRLCSYRVSEIILNDRSDLLEVATSKGYTPLHLAAKNGHNKIVEALLRMVSFFAFE